MIDAFVDRYAIKPGADCRFAAKAFGLPEYCDEDILRDFLGIVHILNAIQYNIEYAVLVLRNKSSESGRIVPEIQHWVGCAQIYQPFGELVECLNKNLRRARYFFG